MANANAYDDARTLRAATPTLHIGCHVVLIDASPDYKWCKKPVEWGFSQRRFRKWNNKISYQLERVRAAAVSRKLSASEIQKEAEAQIGRIQSAGIKVSHVDSHKHTHMFPQVLRPVLKAAKSLGVRAVRNPFEPVRAWPIAGTLGAPGMWLRCAGVMSFQMFAREFHKTVREEGLYTTDGTVGIAATGNAQRENSVSDHYRAAGRHMGTGLPSWLF